MASVEKSGLVVSVAFLSAYGYIPLLAYKKLTSSYPIGVYDALFYSNFQ